MSLRSRSTGAALLSLVLLTTGALAAQTRGKGTGSGFRLHARAIGALSANRVFCGIDAAGELCVDSTGSGRRGGGYWPKNSPQQYLYNSGLQVAGTIDTAGGWGWAGDTTGAYFYDPNGTKYHGQQVEPVWNYSNADDRAHWPDAAKVPLGDATAELYDPALRGRPSASDGDIWTLMWEGNSAQSAGRPHPYGIAVETRGLAWGRPGGNNDIIYFVHTIYNISSTCAADYASVRPELRDKLLELGQRFHASNNAGPDVTIPACGYTMRDLWVGSAHDPDISSDAGNNYGSVNLPLALGYAYEHTFRVTEGGYALPPDLASPPFTNGYGFVGFKFLKTSPVAGVAPTIHLYSNMCCHLNTANTYQLYRYLKGEINPALGDGLCNFDPTIDHICYVKNDAAADMSELQSAGPVDLPPGGSYTFAVAYIFASGVASPGCPVASCFSGGNEVKPGDPRTLSDAALLASTGANLVDSMAGFRGYSDLNGDGKVQGNEFVTVRGSLMQKAQLAQVIFDGRFAIPEAPVAPDFFLVPGNGQVAVLWRPSSTEATGDPFFARASDPANPLYDPNFRQFDTEGYRIYRGRVDDPTKLTLLAQFDHGVTDASGHPLAFRDYLGTVQPSAACAPELGKNLISEGCPVNFQDPPPTGTPYTTFVAYPITSPLVQVQLGDRFLTSNGAVYTVKTDTAITGGGSGGPALSNGGVPFSYLDNTVKNDLRYFYTVTAFDVNSIQSGPSSLESARVLKSATPMVPASNYEGSGSTIAMGIYGRGAEMSSAIGAAPTIDPVTGVFSGPARPATGASMTLAQSLVPQLVTEPGAMTLTLDSMYAGSPYDASPAAAAKYFFTARSAAGTTHFTLPVTQSQANAAVTANGVIEGAAADPAQVARYGGTGEYRMSSRYDLSYAGTYYTSTLGRGCQNGAPGFITSSRCAYNGARWFDGANESFPHPNRGNGPNTATPGSIANFTNAGSVAGVANIFEARSYQTRPNVYRAAEAAIGSAATAADYRVYWGVAGKVDSVIDITHDVRVAFDTTMVKGYTWGFLTQTAATAGGNSADNRSALSISDVGCVLPIRNFPAAAAQLPCPPITYKFVNTVSFGPVVFGVSGTDDAAATPRPNPGFGMYLAGHFFLFEMNAIAPTAPAAGTVWTMRSYVGAISGGGGSVGTAGNLGNYVFTPMPSPFNAVGAKLEVSYAVTNVVRGATQSDLARVHPVPDPFILANGWADGSGGSTIKFVQLPAQAIVRIYSLSGILIRVLEHSSNELGGSLDWDVRNRAGNLVASGVYFYHIDTPTGERRVGRMTVVTSR